MWFYDEAKDSGECQLLRRQTQALEKEYLQIRVLLRDAEVPLREAPPDAQLKEKVDDLRKRQADLESQARFARMIIRLNSPGCASAWVKLRITALSGTAETSSPRTRRPVCLSPGVLEPSNCIAAGVRGDHPQLLSGLFSAQPLVGLLAAPVRQLMKQRLCHYCPLI